MFDVKGGPCYHLKMFGLSFTHLILLAIIALVVLGPEQLPEVARTVARSIMAA